MAKRGRKSNSEKKHEIHTQINGLLIVIVALIGLGSYLGNYIGEGSYGIFGDIIAAIGIALVGNYYIFLFIILLITGVYMFLSKKWPNILNAKVIGLLIFFIFLLMFAHVDYVTKANISVIDMFKETIKDIKPAFESLNAFKATDGAGGGLIGGAFSYVFIKLFGMEGTKIIAIVSAVFGFALLTGISIVDIIKAIANKVKEGAEKLVDMEAPEVKKEIEKAEEDYENTDKIIISSLDELSPTHKEKTETKKEEKTYHETDQNYQMPPMELLEISKPRDKQHDEDEIDRKAANIIKVLKDFAIEGKVTKVHIGPSVTQYEIELKAGTKVSKVTSINREIALALAVKNVRIEAPIPGKNTIGIEFPNDVLSMVTLRDILEVFPRDKDKPLLAALGKDIMGVPKYLEINNAPHLLVAGATGSGKSVCINSIIISLLMRTKPDEIKLLLIDPKQVELNIYNGIPHLLRPVVTKPKEAALALRKIVTETEDRYNLFNKTKTKNIAGYNKYVENYNKRAEDKLPKLPYIIVIVDELSDLMMVAGKEVEDSIIRITQLARAAGIHLIVATQRPSTDVITGLIKANLNTRISFAVASSIDSRTILDSSGAEKLLGKGDMLLKPMDNNDLTRIQGAFVSDEEIKRVIDFVINQEHADYDETYMELEEEERKEYNTQEEQYEDPLYDEVVEFVVSSGKASASLIQRRFRFGYNRAARIIDQLEDRGIIGPQNGSKPREVLVQLDEKED